MIASVPDVAKKVGQKVVEDKGGTFVLTNKDAFSISGDMKLTTNDLVVLRRTIPFASEQPIVAIRPKVKRPGGALVYKAMDPEEFENYKFTEDNFSSLTQQDVGNITDRIRQVKPETDNDMLQQLLTLCDIIVQYKGRDRFTATRMRSLACSIFVTTDELKKMLAFLNDLGIITLFQRQVRYNTIFRDADTVDEEKQKIEKTVMSRRKVVSTKGLQDAADYLRKANDLLTQSMDEIQENNVAITILQKRVKELEEQLDEEKTKNEGFTTVLSSYGKLQEKHNELVKELEEYEESAKSIRKYRAAVYKGVDRVLDHFVQRMMEETLKYEENNQKAAFTSIVTTLSADTKKSVENIMRRPKTN